jgi:SAM-dependent MidA family methyltransferase
MAARLREAMDRSLYGPGGFFRRESPADHFRTSVTASPLFAQAIARLVAEVDRTLGHPDRLDVVDVGAGRGLLLDRVMRLLDWPPRVRATAVEKAPRPEGLDARIGWAGEPPAELTGVLLATEWLDNVPLDVAEVDASGVPRYRLAGGGLGDEIATADRAWVDEWWPITRPGEAAEIGRTRDEAWRSAVSTLVRGLALAVDYGHTRDDRRETLTGFLRGREVPARFDGSTDITAHVCIDSLVATAPLGVRVQKQREALRELGIDGARPPLSLATADPAGYVRALARASQAADLTDPVGMGDHWWVCQTVAIEWSHDDLRRAGRAEHPGIARPGVRPGPQAP